MRGKHERAGELLLQKHSTYCVPQGVIFSFFAADLLLELNVGESECTGAAKWLDTNFKTIPTELARCQ